MKVALATCQRLPEPDPDEARLVVALRAAGASVRMLAWDDPEASAAADELVVLRSTWNYFAQLDAFLAWVDKTGAITRLLNPPRIVRGNARKTYLREVAERGHPVVPTEYVLRGQLTAGDSSDLAAILSKRGWTSIVIKPVVSAGSFLTRRFDADALDEARAFLAEMTAERDAMVQEWMPAVEGSGERALVWIDGQLTHAVRKSPRYSGNAESVSAAVPIAADERSFADRILANIADELLYARVDVIRDAHGTLCLMELELIEPSLFLLQCPEAEARLVAAILRHARAHLDRRRGPQVGS